MCEPRLQAYHRHDQSHDGPDGCEREGDGEGGRGSKSVYVVVLRGTQISGRRPLFKGPPGTLGLFLSPGVRERRDKQEPH